MNDIRNNITHFSLDLEDDEFVLLNELFLQCADYYMMYVEWGWDFEVEETFIKKKNLTIKEAIVADECNVVVDLENFIVRFKEIGENLHTISTYYLFDILEARE